MKRLTMGYILSCEYPVYLDQKRGKLVETNYYKKRGKMLFMITHKLNKGMYIDWRVDGNIWRRSHDMQVEPPAQVLV